MNQEFMRMAIDMALENVHKKQGGGPFGAVIVKNNRIVGMGVNLVTKSLDPTAHAEVCAIRNACTNINNFSLEGCEIYTSCEPCPMCLSAIYWARLDKIYYAANQNDANQFGFDDENFYQELNKDKINRKVPMIQFMKEKSLLPFHAWEKTTDKIPY